MKKALSLLLAVLMLVSLFSGMAFADDDDVIVEEPVAEEVAEEPVVEEPVVEEDSFEAADAFAEEYTEEGSFEAAGEWTRAEIEKLIDHKKHEIDRVESLDGEILGTTVGAMPKTHGTEFYVFVKTYDDAKQIWGDPVKYQVITPHNWTEWVIVPDGEASCETGGWIHKERTCEGYPDGTPCPAVEKTEPTYLPMQEHAWVKDVTYSEYVGGDDRAVVKAPTCQEDGLGNWVCKNCGTYAWGTIYVKDPATATDLKPVDPTYKIERKDVNGDPYTDPKTQELDPRYHDYGSWTVIKAASCTSNGTLAHYCNLCRFQQTQDIPAYNHYLGKWATATDWTKLEDPNSAMVFDHIERVDCKNYVEVWTCCLGDACKGGVKGTPFSVFVGLDGDKRVVLNKDGNNKAALDVVAAVIAGDITESKCFKYATDYEKTLAATGGDYNTEHYDHHRYSTEWELATPSDAPKCMVEGKLTRYCTAQTIKGLATPTDLTVCGHADYKPTPALEPIYGTEVKTVEYVATGTDVAKATTIDDGTHIFVHYLLCTRKDCAKHNYVPEFDFGNGYVPVNGKNLTFKDFTQDNVKDPADDEKCPALALGVLVDHDWGEWTVYVAPTATTLGHWTRTCKYEGCHQVEEFVGTQEEFDEMVNPPYPVLKTGIYHEGEGLWKLYKMGIFAEDFTGIYDGFCDGKAGLWYVVDGLWQFSENGATLVGDTWYFLAGGKVQEVTQLAEYEGEWFLVEDGVIDTTKSALVEYNGGKFVVAVGRIVSEYDGLWQNAKSIGGNDEWYYVADGKVQTDYTGLVQYDGEWFYVENGQLVPYNGQVEYDGGIFNVRDGMVVSQVA